VGDHGQVPAGGRGALLDERPGPVHARVEDLPGLSVRRGVVEREHVEAEQGVGRAPDGPEVALLEQGVLADRQPGDARQALGGLRGAGEVARDDGADALALEPPGQALGLGDAARRERIVGKLDGARGVAERLAVPDQEDQITLSPRRSWISASV
jgi:hypothetical protein